MKIHYFQRYHAKENLATANTMLLLSRLYSYSTDKFFSLLKDELFSDSFEPEIVFNLQEKSADSVPDATITQEGFKIVVETKLSDSFDSGQLLRHLKSFGDEKYKVLITLAPTLMNENKKNDFEKELRECNKGLAYPVIHVNTTFEHLAGAVQNVLDERDYEMQDVLDDFLNYCYNDELIPKSDSWKYMKMQLSGFTFAFNTKNNIYYNPADRGFRAHDYIGLYNNKSIRAIGKICAVITAVKAEAGMEYQAERGDLTEERKNRIRLAIKEEFARGYNLETTKHRYFFVDKFYDTDFKKISLRAPMGSRIFDLTQILGTDALPDTEEIANKLQAHEWS